MFIMYLKTVFENRYSVSNTVDSETHFKVVVVSDKFEQLSLIQVNSLEHLKFT